MNASITLSKQGSAIQVCCIIGLSIFATLRAGEDGPGFMNTNEDNSNKDKEWIYIQNDDVRLGVLRSHGGAIGYLARRGSKFNVLNHYDHGRLIQQSFYGDKDESRWVDKPWRYNPVQGGDYQGNEAELLKLTSTDSMVYTKTIPRHWASGKLLKECTMEQWVTLEGPIVKVRYRFSYKGSKAHSRRHQETPAMFVAPELGTLVTYSGKKPWTGGKLTYKSPGWPNEPLNLAENWAAYVGKDAKGVGVFVPGTTEATCYRFKGGQGSDCSYIAPLQTFALTPNLTFSYTAYFTLGDVPTIRKRFAKIQIDTEQRN